VHHSYGFVHANQKCELCDEAVLSGSFYLFPCQHSFHNSCLIKQMSKHLTRSQLDRVKTLQREIMLLDAASHNGTPGSHHACHCCHRRSRYCDVLLRLHSRAETAWATACSH